MSTDLASAEVTGIEYDSRRVAKGNLFFAFEGKQADGRRFAVDAIARGALAVVSESPAPEGFSDPWIEVEHGRRALALASRNFSGKPDDRLTLVGITGTNGKTTTGYLVDSVLRAAGHITALIGTIEYHIGGRVLPAVNTTPESLDLHRLFGDLEEAGGTHVTMEVSSHALALGRVYGLRFHTSVFTNLTRDHLDFHTTMEDYFEAKKQLFHGVGASPPQALVLNWDDPYAHRIQVPTGARAFWYGLTHDAPVRPTNVASTMRGLEFDCEFAGGSIHVKSPLVGRINIYNLLAACCAGLSLNVPTEAIARGIAACPVVPGRFERVDQGQPFGVVVDYAHTDDALRNTIAIARELTRGRVITLFGCGGDRDRSKRPLMGQAAAELSDFVVLTSDNPRSEDPLAIMNDAMVGIRRYDTAHIAEPDRAAAIRRAITEAHPGDIVVLAGKGHETYQVLRDKTIAFDDRAVAREVLRGFGYGT